MQTLLARDYPCTAWKNGGGSTRQVLIAPPDATLDNFDYRISLASVASAGPFSCFPGIDRQLLLLQGAGLQLLRADGSTVVLDCDSCPLAFAGEENISSQLLDGPVTDFNVMSRRGCYQQALESLCVDGRHVLPGHDGVTLLLLAAGAALDVQCQDEHCRLQPLDALLQEQPAQLLLHSSAPARVLVVRLSRAAPKAPI